MDWIKKLPTWLKGLIALFTSIIGFIVLFLNNIYLSITVSVTSILIATFSLSLYLAFSKKKSEIVDGRYIKRFQKYRYPALIGLVSIPLIVVVLLTNRSSRTFAVIAFVGTATPTITPTITPLPTATITPTPTPPPTSIPPKPSIEKIVIGQAEDHYKMEITAFNPLEQDFLVTHIIIKEQCYRKLVPPRYTPIYEVLGEITIVDVGEESFTFKAEVKPESGELSGYTFTGNGFFIGFPGESCEQSLHLEFDTSFLLPKDAYASFYIKIPKLFYIINEVTEPKILDYSGPLEVFLSKPEASENYEIFEVALEAYTNRSYTMTYTLDLLR